MGRLVRRGAPSSGQYAAAQIPRRRTLTHSGWSFPAARLTLWCLVSSENKITPSSRKFCKNNRFGRESGPGFGTAQGLMVAFGAKLPYHFYLVALEALETVVNRFSLTTLKQLWFRHR